jgi:acylphosphatase
MHYSIRVSGQVQGVFFRKSTEEKAKELGVKGFVRNEPDGTVYIEAEGEPEALEQLKAWCLEGPPKAEVSDVQAQPGTEKGYKKFETR